MHLNKEFRINEIELIHHTKTLAKPIEHLLMKIKHNYKTLTVHPILGVFKIIPNIVSLIIIR